MRATCSRQQLGRSAVFSMFATPYACQFESSLETRYPSIVVEADSSFGELVRYLRLHPLRTRLVPEARSALL
jgi:hypothetical protein